MGAVDFLKKKIARTGLCNKKNPGRITRRKKTVPNLLKQRKRKIERLKEQGNKKRKELATEISVLLCNLFNLSLQEGIVLDSYKEGNVCSILKIDDPSQPSNYRPVTLLNSEDKVFE